MAYLYPQPQSGTLLGNRMFTDGLGLRCWIQVGLNVVTASEQRRDVRGRPREEGGGGGGTQPQPSDPQSP